MRSGILLFVSIMLLCGCANKTTQAPVFIGPKAGKAVVYVYRVDSSPGTDRYAPNVRVNKASIGSLTRRGYFRFELEPGNAEIALYALDREFETFWPTAQSAIVNLELAPGSMNFVELTLNPMTFTFRSATRERAQQALTGSYPLN